MEKLPIIVEVERGAYRSTAATMPMIELIVSHYHYLAVQYIIFVVSSKTQNKMKNLYQQENQRVDAQGMNPLLGFPQIFHELCGSFHSVKYIFSVKSSWSSVCFGGNREFPVLSN